MWLQFKFPEFPLQTGMGKLEQFFAMDVKVAKFSFSHFFAHINIIFFPYFSQISQ